MKQKPNAKPKTNFVEWTQRMCENCAPNSAPLPANRRRKIWETNPARHCSIIGTCLTLGEIRGLARKLGFSNDKRNGTDFNFHGHFVREAGTKSLAAKLLNKLLDRKHAATIKRFQKIRSTEELALAWDETYQVGDIPGPYWAILSHPKLGESLAIRIYGDVHMLSHLAGASNRADRSALKRLELELAPLEERLKKESQRHQQVADGKERIIAELRCDEATLKGKLGKMPKQSHPKTANDTVAESRGYEFDDLKQRLKAVNLENEDLRAADAQLSAMLPALESEVRALEYALE